MLSADQRSDIAGLVLAGGASQRMGRRAKALMPLCGRPMIAYVIDALRPQAGSCALNVNEGADAYSQFGLPLVADRDTTREGPLAGLLAGMEWARANTASARWILSAPCDTPFLPPDLAERLLDAANAAGTTIAIAASNGREHYACGLFSLALADSLAGWFAGSERRVRMWIASHGAVPVSFAPGPDGADPFFNVNRPEDLMTAEAILTGRLA
jgi:molybdopterin-guanine dinucleotide biosynthesis protein A